MVRQPNQFTNPWKPKEDEILDLWETDPDITLEILDSLLPNRSVFGIGRRINRRHLKKCSLKKEEIKLKKEKIDLNKFGKAMIDKLRKEKSLIKIPKTRKLFKGKIKEESVLEISDCHFGKENHWLDMDSGEDFLTYNTEIAVAEANRLVDSVYGINKLLSKSYDIERLNIFGLGDLVEGDLIYSGQRFFIEAGVGNQMLFTVKVLTNLIQEFLKMFKFIRFINVPGNHGRMVRKEFSHPFYNNFDFLAGKMLQQIFKGEKRIEIITPEGFEFKTQIYGWNYWLSHGAQIRSWAGLPWYGIVKYSKSVRTEMPEINRICLAHFHQLFKVPIASDLYTLVNGCWIEKDSFAWQGWKRQTKPEQLYFGVSPKRPETWSFPLTLVPKEEF